MKPTFKIVAISVIIAVLITVAVSRARFQPASLQSSAARPLEQVIPEGALLCIQAKDFSSLLKEWNSSAEKAQWVKSDNFDVFSRSRLFLRLGKASDEFATAAGIPPDMKFMAEAAGKESALAVYDIGDLHLLYISNVEASSFLQSSLWQSRNKFEPRSAGGRQFFYRKDNASNREVAFAIVDDTLVLGTRVDLVAGALELMTSGKGRAISQEDWYQRAVASANKQPGDLRMVLHMEKIAVTPHFRTYWSPQNITQMQSYSTAVSDLYREGDVYREERVILPRSTMEDENALAQSSAAVTSLLAIAPRDAGFYRVQPATSKESLNAVTQKILAPHFGLANTTRLAPQVQLGGGESGSAADLETRIDVEPVSRTVTEGSDDALQKQFDSAAPQAMLVVHSTRKNQDGVLLQMPAAVVIAAASGWDQQALEQGMQKVISAGLTTANMGTKWQQAKSPRSPQSNASYDELDGLAPVFLAVRGKLLYLANDSALMAALMNATPSAVADPVVYAAGFNHNLERQNFELLTRLMDHGVELNLNQPAFFSRNIKSFSHAFAQVGSEDVIVHQSKDKITQTVTYHWNH